MSEKNINKEEGGWIGSMKDRLKDYPSEGAGKFDWSKLEAAPVAQTRGKVRWPVWAGAVAAAACLVLFLVLRTPVSPVVDEVNVTSTAVREDAAEEGAAVEEQAETPAVKPVVKDVVKQMPQAAERVAVVADKPEKEAAVEKEAVIEKENAVAKKDSVVEKVVEDVVEEVFDGAAYERLFAEDDAQAGRRAGKRNNVRRLALALASGSSASGDGMQSGFAAKSAANGINSDALAAGPESGGIYNFYVNSVADPGSSSVMLDGLDYDYKYDIPVTWQVSLRSYMDYGLFVETGICYTKLGTSVYNSNSVLMSDQTFHYLGVPLTAGWSFLDTRYFSSYLSVGAIAEKCVSAKSGGNKISVSQWQYSAGVKIGLQYNMVKSASLFVEPGLWWWADDGSGYRTSRKENPRNFTLTAGIRFSFR